MLTSALALAAADAESHFPSVDPSAGKRVLTPEVGRPPPKVPVLRTPRTSASANPCRLKVLGSGPSSRLRPADPRSHVRSRGSKSDSPRRNVGHCLSSSQATTWLELPPFRSGTSLSGIREPAQPRRPTGQDLSYYAQRLGYSWGMRRVDTGVTVRPQRQTEDRGSATAIRSRGTSHRHRGATYVLPSHRGRADPHPRAPTPASRRVHRSSSPGEGLSRQDPCHDHSLGRPRAHSRPGDSEPRHPLKASGRLTPIVRFDASSPFPARSHGR